MSRKIEMATLHGSYDVENDVVEIPLREPVGRVRLEPVGENAVLRIDDTNHVVGIEISHWNAVLVA